MPWSDRLTQLLLQPWLRAVALLWVVVALLGAAFAFKTSYDIIPKIDGDVDHLVWSAFKVQNEFDKLKMHVGMFDASGDPEELVESLLWLDALYGRLASFTHGNWAIDGSGQPTAIAFADNLREQLDQLDAIFGEKLEQLDANLDQKHGFGGLSSVRIQGVFGVIDQTIVDFLGQQQTLNREAGDQRALQARRLLDSQQQLLLAVFASLGIVFALMWLRSKQAIWLASHDVLTGLGNRSAMIQRLRQLAGSKQEAPKLAVHCIDLDRFKIVNDTLGHQMGDQLLVRFGRRLSAMAGANCFVARTGADEFVVLQTGVADRADAMHLANKIIFSGTNEFAIDDHQLRVGISMGFALSGDDATINGQLLERADLALYEAKRRGGNTAIMFDPMLQERAARHRRIDTDLRKALDQNQLVNYYQPKIDLATRRVCGAEALLRWFHPEHGMIRPDHFIPIAEDTRLIIPIGTWAANQACADVKAWSAICPLPFHIAVNLSPVQFESDLLVSEIRRALKKHDLDPSVLELEITESTLMDHNRQVEMSMKRLRDVGVRFALDDFGTGYSSLSYLDRFRFDKVKIDRSFVMGLNPLAGQSPIIEAVVHIGKGYDFKVCAEGIEDEAHADLLQNLGCDEAQGYYFGKPMPAEEFTQYLTEHYAHNRRESDRRNIDSKTGATSTEANEPAMV